VSVGTVEYLYNHAEDEFFFLELNPRHMKRNLENNKRNTGSHLKYLGMIHRDNYGGNRRLVK
jgi:hypothetical protein